MSEENTTDNVETSETTTNPSLVQYAVEKQPLEFKNEVINRLNSRLRDTFNDKREAMTKSIFNNNTDAE